MSDGEVFHEKQRLELCAIHALNNVLQERVFTKETADDICKRYGPVRITSRCSSSDSYTGLGKHTQLLCINPQAYLNYGAHNKSQQQELLLINTKQFASSPWLSLHSIHLPSEYYGYISTPRGSKIHSIGPNNANVITNLLYKSVYQITQNSCTALELQGSPQKQ